MFSHVHPVHPAWPARGKAAGRLRRRPAGWWVGVDAGRLWDAKVARSTTLRVGAPPFPTSRCPREHHLGPLAPLSCTQPLPASPLQPKLVSLPASSCAARRSFVWPQLTDNRYGANPRASWALTATPA
eukprot:scaffold24495_cov111-Isochrysis_galbana.AAC.3